MCTPPLHANLLPPSFPSVRLISHTHTHNTTCALRCSAICRYALCMRHMLSKLCYRFCARFLWARKRIAHARLPGVRTDGRTDGRHGVHFHIDQFMFSAIREQRNMPTRTRAAAHKRMGVGEWLAVKYIICKWAMTAIAAVLYYGTRTQPMINILYGCDGPRPPLIALKTQRPIREEGGRYVVYALCAFESFACAVVVVMLCVHLCTRARVHCLFCTALSLSLCNVHSLTS